MVFVASKERSRLTQGSPPGELCLRVVGSARDGQVVRLTAAKCAIGSAEGCTLRLRARGVRPVHCLVLRGTHGTVARSWAPNTQINGELFRDAVLQAGDRLTIGPVEFEVLESEAPPAGPTDAGRTVVLDRRPAERSLHSDRAKTFATPKQPTRWRLHVRKLVGEVRKLRSQIDEFQATALVAPAAASFEADEIRRKLENYKQQNEQWETTLQGLQAELGSRERQLATELADLETARQSLDTQRHEWQVETQAKCNELVNRELSHRQATETLQAAQTAFEAERGEYEAGLQASRQQFADREAELQTLAQQQHETARQVEELQSRSAELDERARTLEQREAELQLLTQQQAEVACQREDIEHRSVELGELARTLEQRETDLQTLTRQQHEAARQREEDVERRSAELDELAHRLGQREAELQTLTQQQHETARQIEELQGRNAEMDERGRTLEHREAELQLHTQQQADTACQREDDIERRSAELNERACTLEQREAELQALTQQQHEAARQSEDIERHSTELAERVRMLTEREAELAEALAASRQANEELAACRATFEAQQQAVQSQLDEQRTALDVREGAQSEMLVDHENRQRELQVAHEALAQRQAELEQSQATLATEQNSFLDERQAREAELDRTTQELDRRAAELAERESQLAAAPADLSQQPFETVIAQPGGFDVTEFASRQAELEAAEAAARQAAEELAAARAQFESQQAEALAERERLAHEVAAASDEIAQRRSAVAEAESQLRTERESLFNERLSQEAELRQASEELQQLTAELAEREAQLTVEPTAPTQPLLDAAEASELAEREARLAELQAELDRERDSLREDRQEFDNTRVRSAERLDAEAKDLQREREELVAEREAFETQRRLDLDRRDAEQSAEVERQALVDDDSEDEERDEDAEENEGTFHEFAPAQAAPRRQSLLDTTRSEAGDTARAKPHGDEDVSIEDYMTALLNRSRSGQSVPVIQPAEPHRRNKRKSDVQPPTAAEEVESAENSSPEVPVLDMPATLVQLERRKQLEVRPDMNVLREIGITHARSAIATHGQQRSLRQAYGTLATSMVCFVAAFFVFYFGTHTVFHLTGMAIVVIGIYWLGTSIWAVNKVLTSMKLRRGGLRATLAEIDAEIEALRKETEAELEEAK